MVNKIPQLANFQSKLEHSSSPVPELDGVAAGCHSSLRRFFAVFLKTTTGLHTNSQASGDSLVKVTTSSVLCGLWRSQNPLGLRLLKSGVQGYHWIMTAPTKGYLWSDNWDLGVPLDYDSANQGPLVVRQPARKSMKGPLRE